jgi:hypothetical protein
MDINNIKYLKENQMNLKHKILLAALLAGLDSTSQASIVIDGNLADWGLKQTGQASDWNVDNTLVPGVRYTVEDQTGGANSYLTPGYGGQSYDAEALYTYMDSSFLYLALVTGLAPNTPNNLAANSYGPGDFAIDFGRNGSFEFGIQTTGQDAGKVYRVTEWDYGLWDVNGNFNPAHPDTAHPTSIKTGALVGVGDLFYANNFFDNMGRYKDDKHYVIEAAIPLFVFAGYSGKFDVQWTMNCANDAISADPKLSSQVPEPGTLALLPLGILGLARIRRRK